MNFSSNIDTDFNVTKYSQYEMVGILVSMLNTVYSRKYSEYKHKMPSFKFCTLAHIFTFNRLIGNRATVEKYTHLDGLRRLCRLFVAVVKKRERSLIWMQSLNDQQNDRWNV